MSDDGLTWIKHDGGPMPVPGDTWIRVISIDGYAWSEHAASFYHPEYPGEPLDTTWENGRLDMYAIVKPSPSSGVAVEDQDDDYDRAPLTGGSSPYYTIDVNGVTIECNDIIKALGLPYADGNVLKAVWRIAMDRMGKGKPGNTRLYDAEKIVFFGNDIVERERGA